MSNAVPRSYRWFFLAVGTLALWVGVWGYLLPEYVDWALPWPIPVDHARFLGAMYLSGFVFMAGALRARYWSEIRVVVPMISIWTGMLLVVSLWYRSSFNPRLSQTWIWFGAYIIFPIIAARLTVLRRRDVAASDSNDVPRWLKAYLVVQGAICLTVAGALLLAPGLAASLWPWEVTPMLMQLYSAPFFSFGLGGLSAFRQRSATDVRLYLSGSLVFTGGVFLHSLFAMPFDQMDPPCFVFLVAFGLATIAQAYGVWTLKTSSLTRLSLVRVVL